MLAEVDDEEEEEVWGGEGCDLVGGDLVAGEEEEEEGGARPLGEFLLFNFITLEGFAFLLAAKLPGAGGLIPAEEVVGLGE